MKNYQNSSECLTKQIIKKENIFFCQIKYMTKCCNDRRNSDAVEQKFKMDLD